MYWKPMRWKVSKQRATEKLSWATPVQFLKNKFKQLGERIARQKGSQKQMGLPKFYEIAATQMIDKCR